MSLYLTIISVVLLAPSCLGSHFRGGYFTWRRTEQQSQIQMSYRLSWRRSYSSNHFCDSSHTPDELRPGEGSLICSQGCIGTVTDLAYRCTDFSETEDWTTGTRTFLYNLTTLSPDIHLIFSGCCWINLQVGGGSSWSMKAKAFVDRRKDTGRINSSPSTSIEPIVRVQYGCNSTIKLLVSDPDGDIVRCRWSNGSDECGSMCSSFPGAFLNEDTCTISYQATTNVGYYGVAIQVEDFPITGEKVPYSSVPLQFLVDVYSVNQGCYNLPEFIAPTRADQEIVYITVEKGYFDQIVAISNVPNKRIVEITTVSPLGFVKSALEEYPDVPGSWYINMTWTPSASTANAMHILCFTATDEMKLTSEQRCINLIVSPNIEFNGSNGLQFQYGPLFKDDFMRIQNEKCILVSKEYEFPMFHSVHSKIYVCVTGIVTLDEAFESPGTVNGSDLKGRAILAPYFTDIDKESLRYEGNVYYHVYNVLKEDIQNIPNIQTAEDIIRKIHRDVEKFETHFALFVTWCQVLPSMAGKRHNERMNFQLALVTDGKYTFAFYVYMNDQMKFRGEEVYIGFASKDGQQYMDYRSFTSAVRSIDTKAKSYGYKGLLHYRLTFPSPGQENTRQRCINWYLNERENKSVYDKALQGMPLCPCNPSQLNEDMFYRNNDCFSHGESFCAYILPNWQFNPRDSGKTCCYDKTQRYFLGSGTDAGGFIRYHPHRNALKHKTDDLDMRNVCCVENDLCSLYHSVRPIGACYNIFPAWHAPARGDPHIKTLDGYTYTFNGWGEFTLVKLNSVSEEFELQARTTRAIMNDGNMSDATLFSAFAARDKHGANVHVEMNTAKNGLVIYARMASGSMLNDYTTDYMDFTKDFNIVSDYLSLSRTCRIKDLRVVFTSGIAFTVGIAVNMLNIDVIIPNKFRGMTSGLMGNFDDKQENDLQLKNGTIFIHNKTERHIFEFGMTWAVEANLSAFWYPRGKGYFDYSHLNYTPKFLEDADQAKVARAKEFCGSEEKECIFDLVFTGNEAVANHTKHLGKTSRETEKTLANHVPSISGPEKVNITANETLTYRLHATDDGTFTYKVLDGQPYANITLQTNGEATLTLFLKETNPVNFVVTVVDNFGVQATPHQPIMVFCSNCSRRGTCDFEDYQNDNRTTYSFKYATCKCGPYWDGPECEFDKDGCATHPCSPLRNCTDIPADIHQVLGIGYNCSECPKGFISTIDGRCEDINECNANNGVCTQICNNTYGSYTCSCFQGFQKPDDSDICQDINECANTMNGCDQACNNTIGGYYCSCYKGFVFNNQTRTCEAVENPSSRCNNLDCSSTAGCIVDEHEIPRCFCRKGFQLNLDGRTCVDINECQLAPCQHTCTNTDGSFYCSCFNGNSLEENKVSCKPCESPTYGQNCNETCECEHGAIRCDNVKGCICSEGWTGKHCQEDVDECQIPNICNDSFKICQNTNGSFLCNCVNGYTFNTNGSCQDVDECRDPKLNTCQHICHNEAGGFSCSCFPGYVQSKSNTNMCQDIDECVTGQSGCNQICQNSEGRYTCDCYFGYILSTDRKTCIKVEDACSAYKHINCSQICVLEKHEVFCSCHMGYRLSSDNQTCEDINECGDKISNRCSNNCTNINGGYICSCPAGYQLDNDERTCIGCDAFHYGSNCSNLCNCGIGADKCDPIKGCLCKRGWIGTNCDRDIDECVYHPCTGANVTCINTMGSYVCDCVRGYRSISGVCQDIDECIDPRLNECDQICKNAAGSYSCSCYEDFLSDGTKCRDLSKCTESSYGCACNEGFRLSDRDYHTCIPCTNNTFGLNCNHLCSCNISNSLTVNQTCDRINGTCFCKEGWMGTDCNQDINECEFEPAPCQKIKNSGCYNMEGSFKCLCHLGYKPDGNDRCVEDLQQIRTPIPVEVPDIEFNGSNGLQFQYGPLFKDDFMRIQNEKCILVSKEYEFPMFHSVHSKIYVCVTGIVTFDKAFESPGTVNGSNLKGRAILAPYFTDIDKESLRYEGNVYYHVYNVLKEDIKNVPNIKTAEDIIRKIHRDVENFETHFALFVTWRQVLPSMAGNRLNERMNFQLALVTDGIYTFAFYVYMYDQMKFRGEEVYIGFAAKDGQQYMDYRSFTSAVRSIDKKAKSYGYKGLLHYRLTFPSPGQENTRQRCINWYLNERENKSVYDKALQGMPLCPCNPSQLNEDMFYRNNDCFSHGESFCAYILPNWQFDPRDSGKTCCYDKTQRYFLGSGTDAGGFIRYHPHRNALKHKTDDLDMRNACCVENDLCSLYHSVRPIGACYNISPAWHAPARGDPHIKTLDGYTYTFNGWGEFTLVKLNSVSEEFELQARTTRAMRNDGNMSDATLFSAFAARDKHGANVHVEMNTAKNGLIIYARMASGSMLNDYTTDYMDFTKDFNIVSDYLSLSRTCRIKDLRVVFSSGIAFTVGIAVNMLNINVIIPNKFRGMTSGLMGNFDDKQENDLQLKNGTILIHNKTERHIFEFGMTWAVEANQSAFWYPRGKGYFDYSHLNYTPKFLEDADQAKVARAKEFCGSEEKECIFDLVFTGNEAVANHTKSLGNTSRETEKILANHVPSISGPKKGNIMANETVTYRLHATDDGTFAYKVIDGQPHAYITLQTNGEAILTLFLKETNPVNIVVTVVDNFGVQATPHQPTMVFCSNCSRRGTCDFEDYRDDDRTTYSFKYATCKCGPYWDGPECEFDKDGCATHPCSPLRNCTDIPADIHQVSGIGYNCSECPKGFISTNDGRCEDINECNANNGVCTQICNNTYGSYTCSCFQGFQKSDDSDKCQDINECANIMNGCDQTCNNTIGGYYCSCDKGFVFNNQTRRCEAVGNPSSGCNNLDCSSTAGCIVDEHEIPRCFCRKGFQLNLDGRTCVDINECQLAPCQHTCTNTDGSFYCSCFNGNSLEENKLSCKPCESPTYGQNCNETCECEHGAIRCDNVKGCICSEGWTGKHCQEDVDECQIPNICNDSFKICQNTNGSFLCNCVNGYTFNTNGSCQDVDECSDPELNTCQDICNNEAGGFSCSCSPGYIQSKSNINMCQDIDECVTGQSGCDQICQNSEGRYTCDCYFGYILNTDRKTCIKVEDPCSAYKHIKCSQICVLEKREVFCSCHMGYRLSSDNQTCEDIDECGDKISNRCSNNCTNINGGYICSCPAGYQLDNDERTCIGCDAFHYGSNCSNLCNCGIGADKCDPIKGCLCKTGWNGTNCDRDIDECVYHPCTGANVTCINTMGSYVCDCVRGYRSISGVCQDIDECIDPRLHECDQNCKNTAGSYSCSCYEGFLSNGTKCRDLSKCTESSYGCACNEGFRLSVRDYHTCIPCSNNTFGLNCSHLCSCNISNSLTVNQTCDRINGTCFCKEGWMGTDCNQDINECEFEPAPCQKKTNSGCYNMEGSFKCLCHLGYKPDGNDGCVEDLPQIRTPIPVEVPAGYTSIMISVTLNFKLPASMDIKVPVNYAKLEREADIAISEFYISRMGLMFKQIIIQSIRQGSLIVNYSIIVKKSDEALLKLAEANTDLATGKITLAGQECTVLGLTVGEKQLLVGGPSSDILCNSYLSVTGECASGYECVISNTRPRCSPIKNKDDIDVYVAVGIGAGFFVLLCLVTAVVIIRCRRPVGKKVPMEDRSKSRPDFSQKWNRKHSKTEEDTPNWIYAHRNDIYRSTHHEDASNRYVDFNLLADRDFNEREAIGMNHYDMPSPSHEYAEIPPMKEYRIKRPKVYGLVNRAYENQM